MLHLFRQRANRVDSKASGDLSIPQIVSFLNSGMTRLLKERYGPHNKYGASLEAIQKRIDEWQRLIVAHETIRVGSPIKKIIYPFSLAKTKQPYLFLLRCSFMATKGECQNKKLLSRYSGADNIDRDLDNPDSKPSFEWRETLHRLTQDQILTYSDGTFQISGAEIDYLRLPIKIDIAGYTTFEGKDSKNVDCELPGFLHEEIVEEAVMVYKLALGHPDAAGAIQLKQTQE